MGIRFRKSIKIAPGIKVNLNKKSASVTVGGKRVHHTVSTTGRKTTSVNLPVKGLSYTDVQTTSKKRTSAVSRPVAQNSFDEVCDRQPTETVSSCVASNSAPVEVKYKIKPVISDIPGKSDIVLGIVFLIVGLCFFGILPFLGVVMWIFSAIYFYDYISYKRNPSKGNYIDDAKAQRWCSLLSQSGSTVSELSKLSLPVLISLKKDTIRYFDCLSSSVSQHDIKKYSDLLLSSQKRLVEFSEFVILKGDNPNLDFERYSRFVEEKK